MKTKDDVQCFLDQFFPKLEIWGIFFLERGKNLDALKELGISPLEREQIIRTIVADDFIETIQDVLYNFGEMWVFGKDQEQDGIYIKIALGNPGSNVLCISFHKAEKKLQYAFRQDGTDH